MRKRVVAMVMGVALLAGCATAQPPKPDLSGVVAQQQKQIDGMRQVLVLYANGVNKFLPLCPKVSRSTQFEKGIDLCVEEIKAGQKVAQSSGVKQQYVVTAP